MSPSQPAVEVGRDLDKAVDALDVSKQMFDHLRSQQEKRIEQLGDRARIEQIVPPGDSEKSVFVSQYLDILGHLAEQEVRTQQLKKEATMHGMDTTALCRRHSAPYDTEEHAIFACENISKAHSDSAALTGTQAYPTKQRIGDWLFVYLTENAVEQALYFNIARAHGIEHMKEGNWRQLANHYWQDDSLNVGDVAATLDSKHTGFAERAFGATTRQDPRESFESQSGDSMKVMDPVVPGLGGTTQSIPDVQESDTSTIVKHQASFETFVTEDSLEQAGTEMIAQEAQYPRAITPMILFRPASPPLLRTDSPQNTQMSAADTDCTTPGGVLSPPQPLASSAGTSVSCSLQQGLYTTWIRINEPVTEGSVDDEVLEESLADEQSPSNTPAAAHTTDVDIRRREPSPNRSSIFNFFSHGTLRPRSTSEDHESVDRKGLRHIFLRKHKRNLSTSVIFTKDGDEQLAPSSAPTTDQVEFQIVPNS